MNLSILAGCALFRGIPTAELPPLLRRLHAYTREFDKFQPIYRVGDLAHALCVLLSIALLGAGAIGFGANVTAYTVWIVLLSAVPLAAAEVGKIFKMK